MTFTEAAVEVLRLVGRPLHYKKIAQIAVAKNLLSHVGKSPDMTMSSRLATMVKKDRGNEPIVKVKPGVFALREFDEEALALADADFDLDIDSLPDIEPKSGSEDNDKTPAKVKLPGADVFPEEEDDDVPILAKVQDEDDDEGKGGKDKGRDEGSGRGRRRRRKRRGRGRDRNDDRNDNDKDDGGSRRKRRGRGRDREKLDMSREPEEGDLAGRELAEAIEAVLQDAERKPLTFAATADLLVKKGRLSGNGAALAPTVAAAVRADRARGGDRFRLVHGRLALAEWYVPSDVAKLEREVSRALGKLRSEVHWAYRKKLARLPAAAFVELLATWLNAEGVGTLRAIRRPTSSGNELHLAGTLTRGREETHLAIVVLKEIRSLEPDKIVEVRGALHHYGNASAAWVISLGKATKAAREEVEVAGAPPCVVFDGPALAGAMEAHGIGLKPATVPLSRIDLDLLDELRGDPQDPEDDDDESDDGGRSKRGRRRRGRRRGGRDSKGKGDDDSDDDEDDSEDDDDSGDDDEGKGSKRGRRRRGGRGRGRSKGGSGDEGSDDDDSDDDDSDDEDEEQPKRRRRRRRRKKKDDEKASDGEEEDDSDDEDSDDEGADDDDDSSNEEDGDDDSDEEDGDDDSDEEDGDDDSNEEDDDDSDEEDDDDSDEEDDDDSDEEDDDEEE